MGMFAADIEQGPEHWCDLCEWLEILDDESRAEALTIIADKEWTAKMVGALFKREGFDGGGDTVYNHRRAVRRG